MNKKVVLFDVGLGVFCLFMAGLFYYYLQSIPVYDSWIPNNIQIEITMLSFGMLTFLILAFAIFYICWRGYRDSKKPQTFWFQET